MNCHRANCGHAQDTHSDLMGCLSAKGTGYCDCPKFSAPPVTVVEAREAATLGEVIPSRATDPETSHVAARAVKITARNQRGLLLRAFALVDDATDEQAMELAVGVHPASEYAKRCSELRDGGWITPTGESRMGGQGIPRMVSRITEKGRQDVAALDAE